MKWPLAKGIQDGEYKLDRTRTALEKLGNPQMNNVIHVAGTNGKGSTSAFLQAILEESGYSVNLYTSPHLIDVNERIKIHGKIISNDNLNLILEEVEQKLALYGLEESLTFFEGMTVAAFYAFAKWPADFNIIEVGLGGRFDATNVIGNPIISIITSISFDHTEYLGDTIAKIATEKAEIIKNNNVVVSFQKYPDAIKAIKEKCKNFNVKSYFHGEDYHLDIQNNRGILTFGNRIVNFTPSLYGDHQFLNAATAVVSSLILEKQLGITLKSISDGVSKAVWAGRIEKVDFFHNKEVYIDSAHNEDGLITLLDFISKNKRGATIIAGFLERKDVRTMASILQNALDLQIISNVFLIPFSAHEPCVDPKLTQQLIRDSQVFHGFESAINQATSPIFICGSMYMLGEILSKYRKK